MAITSTPCRRPASRPAPARAPSEEAAGQRREGRGEIGAQHVERAVRQVDQVHDAEDQRQPGRQQEQQQAELHAVEALFDQVEHRSYAALAFAPMLQTMPAGPQMTGAVSGVSRTADPEADVHRPPQNMTAEAHALLPSDQTLMRRSVRHRALAATCLSWSFSTMVADRLQPVLVAVLHHILQVEVLDRDVVLAELEVAAHRLEVGLLSSRGACRPSW